MRPICWLHISDIHVSERDTWAQDVVLEAMREHIAARRKEGVVPDFILATGDLAFSGKEKEYDLAAGFFDAISTASAVPKERIFCVPGNHDIDRDRQKMCFLGARGHLQDQNRVDALLAPGEDLEALLKREEAYRNFQQSYFAGQDRTRTGDGLAYVSRLTIEDVRLAIIGLDSAWLAEGGIDDHGKLLIGERQIINAIRLAQEGGEPPHMILAMSHHPFHLLHEFDRRPAQERIERACHFFHCGHLHEAEARVNGPAGTGCLTLAAGASFETRQSRNTYSSISLDLLGAMRTVTTVQYNPANGSFTAAAPLDVTVQDKRIAVRDNGVGMTAGDLQNFFWTIGASGKRTQEALAAGCVGTFGIGGFANFGVCESLEVISQVKDAPHGTLTRLSEKDIRAAGSAIPCRCRRCRDRRCRRIRQRVRPGAEVPKLGELH